MLNLQLVWCLDDVLILSINSPEKHQLYQLYQLYQLHLDYLCLYEASGVCCTEVLLSETVGTEPEFNPNWSTLTDLRI